jgi:maleylpyruvate isomerase
MFRDAVNELDEASFAEPSLLPGWTRRHLAAHVAANADAIGNLIHWAATGVETPMYRSPKERAAGIGRGETMSGTDLRSWVESSARTLDESMGQLTDEQWGRQVVTAQGRSVPASETPWMRAREVCVHAVDMGTGVAFADLPDDFLEALVVDIVAKRGSTETDLVDGPLADVAAWLAGRPHSLTNAPTLGPWL